VTIIGLDGTGKTVHLAPPRRVRAEKILYNKTPGAGLTCPRLARLWGKMVHISQNSHFDFGAHQCKFDTQLANYHSHPAL
jgi:hypothetical protein